MKLITTLLLILPSVCSYAQIRDYYLAQDFPASRVAFSHTTDLIEITGVSLSFVKTKLNTYLKTKLKYDRIGNLVNKTSDSTFLVTQRFKYENDPEINPKVDFIEFKYKAHLIENDTVVEQINVVGSEAMVGEFYRKYWNQELNVIASQQALVVSENKYKGDLVQLLYQPVTNAAYSSYSITITSTEDIKKVLSGTKTFVAKRNADKRRFDQFRSTTAYHMKDIDSSYYNSVKNDVEARLRLILSAEENITGTTKVFIQADTLGRTWVSVTGKNARIDRQLRDALSDLMYSNRMMYGFKMTTEDTYDFDYSFIRQNVDLLKKPARVVVRSNNYPELGTIASKEAQSFWMDKADMTYNTSLCVVNNQKTTTANLNSVRERTTGGQVVLGIVGGIISIIAFIFEEDE